MPFNPPPAGGPPKEKKENAQGAEFANFFAFCVFQIVVAQYFSIILQGVIAPSYWAFPSFPFLEEEKLCF